MTAAGPLLYARTSEGLLFKSASVIEKVDSVLSYSSHDQNLKLVGLEEFPVEGKITKIAALLGFIRLKLNRYAILANKVEEVGRLEDDILYKVVEHSIVPLVESGRVDSDESEYLKLLEFQLNTSTLFFSYTYDMTNSMQRNEKIENPSWRTADKRFFWNHFLTEELQTLASEDKRVDQFIQPVIYGYAKATITVFNYFPITLGLITRRSIYRAGTRYFRRGIDENGNVSNFNETEQILIVQPTACNAPFEVFSFLQTRGSVPVYWAEINNLKYKPDLRLGDNGSYESTKLHFKEQEELYGDNYLVNLVNQKGHELPVKQSYENAVDALNDPKLHYIYFDFHHECSKMRWHRVKLLIDELAKEGLTNTDVFHKIDKATGATSQVKNEQHSVVRTNCMDCLDRTNVVQSVLANWVLQEAFVQSDVILDGSSWETDKSLLKLFQNMWADNADAVSVAYSGTGALKTDFTRTGQRTKLGAWNDFVNSVSRYYQNNLTDGSRQDSYDLILGGFKPYKSSIQSPFHDNRPLYIQFIPTVLIAALTVLFATILFPKVHFTSSKNLTFFLSSLLTLVATGLLLSKNGLQFVNWPRLVTVGFLNTKSSDKTQTNDSTYSISSKYSKPHSNKKD
ncbi:hypothetical protein Kpol_1054p59 [Vanderwaltozyma polyspora DSM 70294]|uniref:SAC domain-containing protein n=1 Tax=Vanderwaltozyma polyspora (strain ATCC 22028 / DSM 70294 / BCRC 21397 / CBS 2163 / NBRC 10782 / NRRL Y-8283 / UCD 57-17) TaxID=436907 RepID=A7TIE5_VANPO|nr:uncharacterized protein Kpol_1054p59 [Vanderwaltozyma polyspora DSM 70294]EDO18011.1 hypothetical protein Kpol_1054p59 [Vanderwaltozyma polyspora DSM 70294]